MAEKLEGEQGYQPPTGPRQEFDKYEKHALAQFAACGLLVTFSGALTIAAKGRSITKPLDEWFQVMAEKLEDCRCDRADCDQSDDPIDVATRQKNAAWDRATERFDAHDLDPEC